MRRSSRPFVAPLVLVLACGDDGPPTSAGSGDASSGSLDTSSGGSGATSLATATSSDGSSTSTSGSGDTSGSTGMLDGTSTGGEVPACAVCAETDICVLDFSEKNCPFCNDLELMPFAVVCVPRAPAACDDALTHTRACALALCGSPYADSEGCGCSVSGDFVCGVNPFVPPPCDYWDPRVSCAPDGKCVPARDEQQQPLPYTECIPFEADPLPLGAPCMVAFWEDPCEPSAYCDEVDPDTMMGVCRPLCAGTEAMPSCAAPGDSCVLFADGQPQWGGVCRPA